MDKIVVFSGNRAEFGILFPLIQNLASGYEIDLVLSGAHVIKKWNTQEAVKKQLQFNNVRCNVITFELDLEENMYKRSFGKIYDQALSYYIVNEDIKFAVVLGDRIETFAFAVASFYSQIPLLHYCGGDVVTVQNYDTNVRHSISKLAEYHFVTNETSKNVLLQMGEEPERVFNVGNLSFDYDRMGLLTSANEIKSKFKLEMQDVIAVFTYHPASAKSSQENLMEFKSSLTAVVDSIVDKIIVTYPNNDPGYDMILDYIHTIECDEKIQCVNSLGTYNYLSIMKNYKTVIVGNSSSGLLETVFYCVPVVNIGDRQNGRIRGENVIDVLPEYEEIKEVINDICNNYEVLREKNQKSKYIFGDGNAAIKSRECIDKIAKKTKEEMLYKKFLIR